METNDRQHKDTALCEALGRISKQAQQEPLPEEFEQQVMNRMADTKSSKRWMRVAAVFIGVLMVSCICFAAYRLAVGVDVESMIQEAVVSDSPQLAGSYQREITESDAVRTFENTELQQILQELSDYYHVGVEFHNEQSRHTRLYTKWDTAAPLSQIIERLNGFEKVSIRLIDNQIIAE